MITLNHVSKYFYRPYREAGLKGAIKTLFTHKKIETKAVDDISFKVNDGDIVGYIGSNGAGKSTTIKMMSGILTPTKGEVLFDGLKPYDRKDRKNVLGDIGVVFGQRTQLWWDLPLRDSFDLYRDIYGIDNETYKQRLDYLTKLLSLEPFMMSQVRSLSLGQRMRADLGASLIHNPKVLFLDEPTIGLDVLVKEKITDAIKLINKQYGTTIILTTHDMKDIQNLCKRVIIIDTGHILYDGTLMDIKKRFGDYRHIYVLSPQQLNIEEAKKALGKEVDVEMKEDGYLEFTYNADVTEANVVYQFITKNLEVKDIKVDGTTLSSIVKQIYEKKSL